MQVTVLHEATVVAFEGCLSVQEVDYVVIRHAMAMLPDSADPARFIDEVYDAVQEHMASGRPAIVRCPPVSVAIEADAPGC